MPASRAIAVAIHDVEPATYRRCALIRDRLGDLGIDRVTLLVIPAPDRTPSSSATRSRPTGCTSAESVLRRAAKRTAVTYDDRC